MVVYTQVQQNVTRVLQIFFLILFAMFRLQELLVNAFIEKIRQKWETRRINKIFLLLRLVTFIN